MTLPYDVSAVSAPHGLRVALTGEPAGELLIVVDEIQPDPGKPPVQRFALDEAIELRDALSELICEAGACDCGHPPPATK